MFTLLNKDVISYICDLAGFVKTKLWLYKLKAIFVVFLVNNI